MRSSNHVGLVIAVPSSQNAAAILHPGFTQMTTVQDRPRFWAGFVVPFIAVTLFWADFGHTHGSYPHKLFAGAFVGFLAAVLSFIVTHRLVNPVLRYLSARYDRDVRPLPNEES